MVDLQRLHQPGNLRLHQCGAPARCADDEAGVRADREGDRDTQPVQPRDVRAPGDTCQRQERLDPGQGFLRCAGALRRPKVELAADVVLPAEPQRFEPGAVFVGCRDHRHVDTPHSSNNSVRRRADEHRQRHEVVR